MAKVPKRAEITTESPGGEVTFTIDDEEALEQIDKSVYNWHPDRVGSVIGMDVKSIEVER